MRKILFILGCVLLSTQAAKALDMVYPVGKYNKTIHDNVYFMGSVGSGETLYYQGEKVKTGVNGGFAFNVPVKHGRNQVFLRVCKNGQCSFKQYYVIKEVAPVAEVQNAELININKTVLRTIEDGVPLRRTPVDSGMNRMSHLAKDTMLIVDGRKGDFFRVYLSPTKYGWVSRKDVTLAFDEYGYQKKPSLSTFYNIDDKAVPNLSLYRAAFSNNLPYEVIDNPNELIINIFNVANVNDETLVLKVTKTENIKYTTAFSSGDFTLLLKNRVKQTGLPLTGVNIVVDPGHGGAELGALGIFRDNEKNINLSVARELALALERQGAKVYMTRDTDVDVALTERVKFAKANDADIFLSIHMNSVPQGSDPTAHKGSSVYYYNNSAKGLAESLKNSMVVGLGTNDDGVHQESFAVLRASEYLGVLAEICYMVNPNDSDIYKSYDFAKKAAESLTNGVVSYVSAKNVSSSAQINASARGNDGLIKTKKEKPIKAEKTKTEKVKNVKVKVEKAPKVKEEKATDKKPFFDKSVREKYKQEAIYVVDKNDTKWYRPKGKKKRAKRPPREIKKSTNLSAEQEVNIFASGDYEADVADKKTFRERTRSFFSKVGSYFYNGAKN